MRAGVAAHQKLGAGVFLLGGRGSGIQQGLGAPRPVGVYDTGSDNSLPNSPASSPDGRRRFSDTLGMHLAIALKKRTIALFGPTSPRRSTLRTGVKLFAGRIAPLLQGGRRTSDA